jgi:catechol 2,3-dioxygenase
MGGTRRFDHLCISVRELQPAVDFYTKGLGLVVIRNEEKVAYLGCGVDDHFDLALKEGSPALEHIALRIDDAEEFARIARNLDEVSVKFRELGTENEPGLNRSVAFKLPSGIELELVRIDDADYYRPTKKRSIEGFEPVIQDVDHGGLYSVSVQKDAEFLRDTIGMRISDARVGDDGTWKMAFLRRGCNHHDIAIFNHAKYHMSHYAWNFENIEGMVKAIDRLARNKIELEIVPYRHYIGSNISCYFRGPDNLRIEYCTEMATMNDNVPTSFWTEHTPAHSAWGGIKVDPSFWLGI